MHTYIQVVTIIYDHYSSLSSLPLTWFINYVITNNNMYSCSTLHIDTNYKIDIFEYLP